MPKQKLFIEKILTLGIDQTYNSIEIKRIRILNGIAFFAGIILLITSIVVFILLKPELNPDISLLKDFFFGRPEQKAVAKENWLIFYPVFDFTLGIIVLSTLLLNKIKKHTISIYIICFVSTIFVSLFYLTSGAMVVFFFLAPTLIPVIFFTKKTRIYLIIFFNITILMIFSVILNNNDSLFVIPTLKNTITMIINYLVVLFILYFIISHFKKENEKNEQKLQKQNIILQSQSDEITSQRDELFNKNEQIQKQSKNIISSIEYAKKIQNAVLPKETVLLKNFSDYFIFYKPRDIVSGDFYWIKKIEKKIIIAAADSTGHGVPGAFMSILGISLLNEIVNEISINNSGAILDLMRQRVKTTLKQSGKEDEQKDGWDMSFCIIDPNNFELQYSGANNSLYIIREQINKTKFKDIKKIRTFENKNSNLIEIMPNRQPISIFIKETPFSTHKLNLQKNDKLYLFSDGYIDQIGGKKNEKFMSKKFKKLLLNIHNKPMKEQKYILKSEMEIWKGENAVLDDMLIIGVKM